MHADASQEERATDLVHTVLFRQLRRTLPATNLAVRQVTTFHFPSLSHANMLPTSRNAGFVIATKIVVQDAFAAAAVILTAYYACHKGLTVCLTFCRSMWIC